MSRTLLLLFLLATGAPLAAQSPLNTKLTPTSPQDNKVPNPSSGSTQPASGTQGNRPTNPSPGKTTQPVKPPATQPTAQPASQPTAQPTTQPATQQPPSNPQTQPQNTNPVPSESPVVATKKRLIEEGYQVCMTHPDYGKVYCKKPQNKGERTTYVYIDEDGIAMPLDEQVVKPEGKRPDRKEGGESPSSTVKPAAQPYVMPKISRQLMAPNQLTTGTYYGDVDGNGVDDILSCNGKELVIKQADPAFSLLLNHTFSAPIARLIVGDFATGGRERGKKQVIALLSDGTTQAFAISDDNRALWWWFTQPTFIAAEERYTVANFDKEIDEEIMVHNPTTGKLRFYKRNAQGGFGEMPNFELGNLTGADLRNIEIIAGAFSGDHPERKDLLVADHNTRQLRLYASVMLENGNLTFWWAFNTNGNLFPAGSQLYAANLNGGPVDGLLIRNGNDNSYTLYRMEFGDGNLVRETSVNIGQLPIRSGECKIVPAKVRDTNIRGEKGGAKRDDILLVQLSNQEFTRTDARFDGQALTYWWAFNNIIIGN